MELTKNAKTVLEKRYLRKSGDRLTETPEDLLWRVANNIAQVDRNYYPHTEDKINEVAEDFYDLMDKNYFLPNSPTLMNAGSELQQLSACFVLPVEDSMESIFESIKNSALIHKSGGGTGFSFTRIRPKNDVVLSTGGIASGPISFLKVFNSATEAVKQGGTRRGANMGVLRVDHPDILEFISCKEEQTEITNFNISVALTENFMKALENGENFKLVNPKDKKTVKEIDPKEIFNKIVEMAWKNGEPGIIFLDKINEENPTPELGEIESTNPCGEQPLLPYESCNLGSVNLSVMVDEKKNKIDYKTLKECVHKAVHFLDNVIDANEYPLDKIREVTLSNRKIGLGIMGWADMLYKLNIPYNSDKALETAKEIMKFIDDESKEKSRGLAEERGAFPNFEYSIYKESGEPPIRNATTTTIAPTGSISIIAGTSGGIEPNFALAFSRNILDKETLIEVNPIFEGVAKKEGFYSKELMEKISKEGSLKGNDEIPDNIKDVFVVSHDIESSWHIKMQAAFQEYTDNAVSKTVNLPSDATKNDIADIYKLAYELNCKGVTVYRDKSRDEQVLQKGDSEDKKKQKQKEKAAEQSSKPYIIPRKRPDVTIGKTEKISTGCGNLYVTVNEDDKGLCEVFASMGKSGGCAASQSEATARLISMALRSGLDVKTIIKELRAIRCPNPTWDSSGGMVLSCPDAIGIVLDKCIREKESGEKVDKSDNGIQKLDRLMGACPECGGHVRNESGCITCFYCGYSKC
ncbi:vitamin B12-dependent ribonucleotide reductase [Natranaerofaba carboxydovora]|uniref:vitamin B12-dependent ribonucleotide reductase n=1 Tax=Natranaerofaba carboxydovora TaxID=2742683 RepID=UPI001F12D3BB|nr:vitamin B12-dependent ribonucleotide reductase [Natranaerofaba carboxydovora]UMZ75355.1 Vitamin B12-dependent ribonucleoside-diphosphate reductase [Natranaerofaba carboxydovora]